MKKSIFTLAAISAAMTPVAQASETSPIVVTATRTAQTADQTMTSVSVITREDIENSQAISLEELISSQMGIDTTTRGGYGKNSSLFMRGTNSNHTLILVDGLKVGSATLGTTDFQFIPLEQIERIEIVRGPRSSLYGSEAIGGVIQIFTRQGTKKHQTRVSAGAGSDNLRQASIHNSGKLGNTGYSVTIANTDTDGFDAHQDSENDEDGYSNTSAAVRVQHNFGDVVEISGHASTAQGDTQYDGSYQNNTDFIQQNAGLKVSLNVLDTWYSTLLVGNSRDQNKNFLDNNFSTLFTTKRQQASWQNDLVLADEAMLTVGVDYQKDNVEGTTAYAITERDNVGIFTQFQNTHGRSDYSLSLRSDDNESFSRHTTGSIAWGFNLNDEVRFTASYGEAFKAPTFNDLYYPGSGNANLNPEESQSVEIGLSQQTDAGEVAINIYRTHVDNLIDWSCVLNCFDADWSNDVWQPVNLNKADIRGLEFSLKTVLAGWQSTMETSFVNPRDESSNNVLQRRSRQTIALDFVRSFGKATFGVKALGNSKRYDNAWNSTINRGYGVVNLRGEWAFNKQWRVKGTINNVGDKAYETVAGYNTAGRTVFVSVSYDM